MFQLAIVWPIRLRRVVAIARSQEGQVRRHFIDRLTSEQVKVLGDLAHAVVEHLADA
jgi:hypothetical protein